MRYWNEIIIDVKASKLRLSLSLVYIALIVIFLGKKSRSIPRMVGEILVWYFAMQGITALYYQIFGDPRYNLFQESQVL